MSFHIDKFNNPECRAGGKHQWFGDIVLLLEDGKEMNNRKYNLLSDKMKRDVNVVGSESTCNKCGIPYTQAFNPYF